jgi:predicted DNA binding protein
VNICRLRVPLPDSAWIAEFSSEHPELRIEVLSRLDIGRQRSLTELRLHAPDPRPLAEELRKLPQVETVDELEGAPSEIHLRVVNRTSEFISIFRELHVMRRFPFTIEAGVGYWVVVAPRTKIERLMDRIRERVPTASLEAVRHADPARPTGPLTPRQADLLRRAMAAGYFEVPRKVTLTALARNLGMAPSSLSESLAIVEKKLLERWPTPE